MSVKETYQKLSKKYQLPPFAEIDTAFEISTIEYEEFLLREVRRKMVEKLDSFIKVLEEEYLCAMRPVVCFIIGWWLLLVATLNS